MSELSPAVEDVINEVCEQFHVTREAVMSESRLKSVSKARQMIYARLRVAPFEFSTTEIGNIMGRDHTTVIAGLKRVGER